MKRWSIRILGLLALAAAALLFAARERSDGLDAFPHAFLAAPTYDPAAVRIVVAPIASPPAPPAGCAPVWQCDDPAFRDQQGRAWLFPVQASGREPVLPLHPVLQRRPAPETCRIYRTDEGRRQLEAFAASLGR